jgi:hypothetical protein
MADVSLDDAEQAVALRRSLVQSVSLALAAAL